MKFTTLLFSLTVIAATNASASASSGEGGGGFMSGLKEVWGDFKSGLACVDDVRDSYTGNEQLSVLWTAWGASLKIEEDKGGSNSSSFYSSSFSNESTAALKEHCEKEDGNFTWTPVPDRSFLCYREVVGFDTRKTATVTVSNNGVCLPTSKICDSMMNDFNVTATDIADDDLYNKFKNQELDCNTMEMDTYESGDDDEDGSGGVVTSTNFIGSLVAATAVIAFTMLI